eukprot:354430-Chlamydomonas_euryale.AAC.5
MKCGQSTDVSDLHLSTHRPIIREERPQVFQTTPTYRHRFTLQNRATPRVSTPCRLTRRTPSPSPAESCYAAGEHAAAAQLYGRLLPLAPHGCQPEVLNNMGNAMRGCRQLSRAADCYGRAAQLLLPGALAAARQLRVSGGGKAVVPADLQQQQHPMAPPPPFHAHLPGGRACTTPVGTPEQAAAPAAACGATRKPPVASAPSVPPVASAPSAPRTPPLPWLRDLQELVRLLDNGSVSSRSGGGVSSGNGGVSSGGGGSDSGITGVSRGGVGSFLGGSGHSGSGGINMGLGGAGGLLGGGVGGGDAAPGGELGLPAALLELCPRLSAAVSNLGDVHHMQVTREGWGGGYWGLEMKGVSRGLKPRESLELK